MAKAARPSISDQLAAVAATRPREDVALPAHEEARATPSGPQPTTQPVVSRDDAATSSRRPISTRKRDNETADGMKVRQRVEKPHASLYAHPRVFKKLREIAAAEDCKAHDLYVEGLRLVLARYGYDLDKLERGEA